MAATRFDTGDFHASVAAGTGADGDHLGAPAVVRIDRTPGDTLEKALRENRGAGVTVAGGAAAPEPQTRLIRSPSPPRRSPAGPPLCGVGQCRAAAPDNAAPDIAADSAAGAARLRSVLPA